MTKAKHLHGPNRTQVTESSFKNKIAAMRRTLAVWVKLGRKDESKFPVTLFELAEWDDPEKGIYRWSSNSVTQRSSRTYGTYVAEYWQLQEDALPLLNGSAIDTLKGAKELNQALAQQNAALVWQVMELRDALSRVDAENEALKRLPFP